MNKQKKKSRKTFTDHLPRKKGVGIHKGKEVFDWKASVGYDVEFVFDDISGVIKIIDSHNSKLTVLYKGKECKISAANLKDAKISCVIGLKTSEFRYDIGHVIIDEKRNLTITGQSEKRTKRGQRQKWYNYTCNDCGWTGGEQVEHRLENGAMCGCCTGQEPVAGINDIPTVAPELVQFFQGGEEEAKHYTIGTHKKIYPKCPRCGRVKDTPMSINKLYANKSIGCRCSDGISYPNKFLYCFLSQLKIKFNSEMPFGWSEGKLYDVFIRDKSLIIEAHGAQHYCDTGFSLIGGRTLEEEQANDAYKKKLALSNGIKAYVTLNCRQSDPNWIRASILKSKLPKLLNFKADDIDWQKCHKFAMKGLNKKVCEFYNLIPTQKISRLAKITGLSENTIRRYLRAGEKAGLCDYSGYRDPRGVPVKVICLNNKRVFNTLNEASKEYNIHATSIAECCRGNQEYAGMFKNGVKIQWQFYDEYKKKPRKLKTDDKIGKYAPKQVICLTTGKVFDTAKEAARYYNIKKATGISMCCNGKRNFSGKLQDGTKLAWMFYSEYQKLNMPSLASA